MKVIKYENDSVLIKDGAIQCWLDIWIENEDVICDWNKLTFFKSDSNDMKLKKWQDKLKNFEEASSLVIKTLEDAGIIFQDRNGKWFQRY